MIPFTLNYVSKIINQTRTKRSYSLTSLAGTTCYKFPMPSIITTSGSYFNKDLVVTIGAEA